MRTCSQSVPARSHCLLASNVSCNRGAKGCIGKCRPRDSLIISVLRSNLREKLTLLCENLCYASNFTTHRIKLYLQSVNPYFVSLIISNLNCKVNALSYTANKSINCSECLAYPLAELLTAELQVYYAARTKFLNTFCF